MNDFDKERFVGDTVQMNIEGLWLCGASYLPSMAVPFAEAAKHLGSSAATGADSMSRTTVSPYPPHGEVSSSAIHGAWAACRDGLQNRLGESIDNLYAIGDALERIAWAADELDGDNSSNLRDTAQDYLDSDRDGTDKGKDELPIWRDGDRPQPENPEESTERREQEARERQEAYENDPPGGGGPR